MGKLEKTGGPEKESKKNHLFPKRDRKSPEQVQIEAEERKAAEAMDRQQEEEELSTIEQALEEKAPEQNKPSPQTTEKERRTASKRGFKSNMNKLASTYAKRLAKNPPDPDAKLWEQFGQQAQLLLLKVLISFGGTDWIRDLLEDEAQGDSTLSQLEKGIGLKVSENGDQIKVEWVEVKGLMPANVQSVLVSCYGTESKLNQGALGALTQKSTLGDMKKILENQPNDSGNTLLLAMQEAGAKDEAKLVDFISKNEDKLKAKLSEVVPSSQEETG